VEGGWVENFENKKTSHILMTGKFTVREVRGTGLLIFLSVVSAVRASWSSAKYFHRTVPGVAGTASAEMSHEAIDKHNQSKH